MRPLRNERAAWSAAIWLGFLVAGCEQIRKEPWETAPLAQGQLEVKRLEERASFTIERVRFFSREMNEPRFFIALVPKAPKPPDGVLIFCHGWFDRPEYLLTELKVDQVYEKLLAGHEIRPGLVVMPDVRFPSFYRENADRYPFPNYLTLVAEECASAVSKVYGISFDREKWGIGGFSFGGRVAIDVGRRYAGRFGSVDMVSSFADDQWTYWPATLPPPGRLDPSGRGKQTIVVPGPVPRLFLACGNSDRARTRMRSLHERFLRLGIPHEWSTGPGGHTWQYWSTVIGPILKFHLGAPARPEGVKP